MNLISRRDVLKVAGTGLAAVAAIPSGCAKKFSPISRNAKGPFLILTCDGGGIRGLLTACFIQRIQAELEKEKGTNGPIDFCRRVNCFAGTSTGGIIALGMAAGLSPDQLVALYKSDGPSIFEPFKADGLGFMESTYYNTATSAIRGLDRLLAKVPLGPIPQGWSSHSDQLFFSKYDSAALQRVLEKTLGKELTLGQFAASKSVLVTSFLLGNKNEPWRPVLLHNLHSNDEDAKMSREMTAFDAALCTSAAPTCFPPHHVPKVGYFADGGVFANNPGVAAITTALRSGLPLENIRVLSLGTGSVANYMKVPPWDHLASNTGNTRCGLLAWLLPMARDGVPAIPLVSAMFDAGAGADELYCRGLLTNRYRRIQIRLEKDIAMDDGSAIPRLIELADAYFDCKQWKDEDRKWLLETYLA